MFLRDAWIVPIVDSDRLELALEQALTDCDDLFAVHGDVFPIFGVGARCAERVGFLENADDHDGLLRRRPARSAVDQIGDESSFPTMSRSSRERLSSLRLFEMVPPVRREFRRVRIRFGRTSVLRLPGCLFGSLRPKLSFTRSALGLFGSLSVDKLEPCPAAPGAEQKFMDWHLVFVGDILNFAKCDKPLRLERLNSTCR